ncbi:MAG: hypothetical protein EOO77_17440 [Oxalobacteraceae bacterium]|nr:MAG: hypothetical protein EOO77_17440 [Oxalobacteraceae bacterium]
MAEAKTYYTVDRVEVKPPKPGEFRIMTAAVMDCGLCGVMIDGMGGGGTFICMPCGDALSRGALVGCVKWPVTER